MKRRVKRLREQCERKSKAPRYISLTCISKSTGIPARTLGRWLRHGPVWIPRPAVLLGANGRPGWEPEAVIGWEPGLPALKRPEPVRYWNTTEMQERWHVTTETLWLAIAEDGSIPAPDMWLAGTPGWRATEKASRHTAGNR
ncbi:hypothetical protein [Nocardia carnea]|uniref:hypothetical protein n=1 Tax=Nocardia carnea TaxID=37328 RepID=UPI0024569DFD|nr:hypothetical protein [Nocardia carnea]